MTAVRIKKYKVSMRGERGTIVSIPPVQLKDMGLKPGEYISAYTGHINGRQVLVFANDDSPVLSDDLSGQGRELKEYMEARA